MKKAAAAEDSGSDAGSNYAGSDGGGSLKGSDYEEPKPSTSRRPVPVSIND